MRFQCNIFSKLFYRVSIRRDDQPAEPRLPRCPCRSQLRPVPLQELPFQEFAAFAATLQGDERSESQLFLIRPLEAFGHDGKGLPDGSRFEYRVRFPQEKTKYADFVWPGRVLLEMKSRGKKLSAHQSQTWDGWTQLVPHRTAYAVLCDFDEFWIYDFNT